MALHCVILSSRKMHVSQERIEDAARILRQGGIVVFPTDTVYGLGADAFQPAAVDRIYEVKKRATNLEFPLLIANLSQLAVIAGSVSGIERFLARRFWPGGLTLVLPKAPSLAAHLSRGPNIAVRIPDDPVCLALIRCLGNPVIGTSANISGKPAALTADEARKQLGDTVDLIIDGGSCAGGRESTIVMVSGEYPVILRQGVISRHRIEEACNEYDEVSYDAYSHRK